MEPSRARSRIGVSSPKQFEGRVEGHTSASSVVGGEVEQECSQGGDRSKLTVSWASMAAWASLHTVLASWFTTLIPHYMMTWYKRMVT